MIVRSVSSVTGTLVKNKSVEECQDLVLTGYLQFRSNNDGKGSDRHEGSWQDIWTREMGTRQEPSRMVTPQNLGKTRTFTRKRPEPHPGIVLERAK